MELKFNLYRGDGGILKGEWENREWGEEGLCRVREVKNYKKRDRDLVHWNPSGFASWLVWKFSCHPYPPERVGDAYQVLAATKGKLFRNPEVSQASALEGMSHPRDVT